MVSFYSGEDPYLHLRNALRRLDDLKAHGCSDGNCKMRRKSGMCTNGGCRCIKALADAAMDVAVEAEKCSRFIGAPLYG